MSLLQTLLARREPGDSPLIMGVVNVTPDSFSDGGQYFELQAACARIDKLIEEGTDIVDIGGESTRPGSNPVPTDEQVRRIRDAVRYAADCGVIVSVDTTNPAVAQVAIDHGATVINDVSCLRDGDALAKVAAQAEAALCIMHAREPMSRMKGFSTCPDDAYGDVVADVAAEWRIAEDKAIRAGVKAKDLLFDPGLGFNKNARHSTELLARLNEFASIGHHVVLGPSRKSFLCADVESDPQRRLGGTIAACLAGARRGAAVLRVHDVLEVRQALAVARAVDTARDSGMSEVQHA